MMRASIKEEPMDIERVVPCANEMGEGPLWHPVEHVLYWVDIDGQAVQRYDPASGLSKRFATELPIGVLGWRRNGGFVAASARGFAFWEPGSPVRMIADPEADRGRARFNDGAVDAQGRFWAGTVASTPTGSLYRLDVDLSVHRMEGGVTISNGIGWSPDQRTMYYTDSPVRVIYAYDFDPATGEIANRRPFVSTPDDPSMPDGLAVDAEGCLWCARWDGWRISRYDPEGRVMLEVPVPVQQVTSCAFGGANLDELYITSATSEMDEAARRAQPWAGDLLRVRPGVRGVAAPGFAG
jgi:sugar lactone lactonase YvrE